MPSRPYLDGREDLYLIDGALVAHRAPHPNVHGRMTVESATVMTLDKRYSLAHWMPRNGGTCWRTSSGDVVRGEQLRETIARCRRIFGANPRYALTAGDCA